MEILIVGVILVALMAYVSTRIKRSAAEAFERERIETDDFTLVKPDGFLHPLNSDSVDYAFEAYSKEFGRSDETAKLRQARAVVKVYDVFDGKIGSVVEEEAVTEKGAAIKKFRKVLKNGKFYELEISVLKEHRDEYAGRVEEMLESFNLK
jgi:hypothetical protein